MIFVEYIWLDGTKGMPKLRSKTRAFEAPVSTLPNWKFDGGSTKQGTLKDSDRLLKPVKVVRSPFHENKYFFALCEVCNMDGTPHETNTRVRLKDTLRNAPKGVLFGFEQEYTLVHPQTKEPLVPGDIEQGDFYCGVGAGNVLGRGLSDNHLFLCSKAGINLFGANAEVMLSQWEFQTQPREALDAADELWLARYILERMGEVSNYGISYDPKLYPNLNGAGCHTNISTERTRSTDDWHEDYMDIFKRYHLSHMSVYGEGNEARLTGDHETSNYQSFTWGYGDRGASVRLEKGAEYFEDRRPGANCDPYLVTSVILNTLGKC